MRSLGHFRRIKHQATSARRTDTRPSAIGKRPARATVAASDCRGQEFGSKQHAQCPPLCTLRDFRSPSCSRSSFLGALETRESRAVLCTPTIQHVGTGCSLASSHALLSDMAVTKISTRSLHRHLTEVGTAPPKFLRSLSTPERCDMNAYPKEHAGQPRGTIYCKTIHALQGKSQSTFMTPRLLAGGKPALAGTAESRAVT